MPKERNKADGYREKVPIKREKIDACIGYQPAIDYCKEHGYKWY